jgi:hypothetical protein
MPLKLGRAFKREVEIHGAAYTVTLSPLGVRLVRKGFRKGVAISWRRLLQMAAGDVGGGDPLVSGDTAPGSGGLLGPDHS